MNLAIVNGVVWGAPQATSVVCSGDRIAAIGSGTVGTDYRVVDARGGAIIPAFNDAHVHFLMGSRSLGELDLFGVQTLPEIEERIADYVRRSGPGWIVGRGWLYSAFPGGMPTVEQLDRLVPDRPAFLESFDAHTGWANSNALKVARVPERAVLREAAMHAVTRHIPKRTTDEDLSALRAGMRLAASRGIASVQEAGDGWDQLKLWDTLRTAGDMTLRVRLAFDMTPDLDEDQWRERLTAYEEVARAREGDTRIRTGIVKAFADGVVESMTASLLEPYAGESENRGTQLWPGDQLLHHTHIASERGWQVQVHAIGDAAIRQALDAFDGCDGSRRHRVEHVESPSPEDVPRFERLGVIASMQPQHSAAELIGVWRRNLGPERAARGWPWAKVLESGGRLAFGTDWPVVPEDPMASLAQAARTIPIEDAIAAWTSGAAYAEHAESFKGSLREGMLADITVLDRDLTKVEATVVGGRLVYEA